MFQTLDKLLGFVKGHNIIYKQDLTVHLAELL